MAYPLQNINNEQLQKLAKVLWKWEFCGQCEGHSHCSNWECPWARSKKLSKYWLWYKETIGAYVPDFLTKEAALRTHDDLLNIIKAIKTNPDTPRGQLTQQYFASRGALEGWSDSNSFPATTDQSRAFNIAANVVFMVNCAPLREASDYIEHHHLPIAWRNEVSATRFISEAFPTTEHPYFDKGGSQSGRDILKTLSATRMKKAGLHFEPTNDLRDHLSLDHKKGIVRVFHRTAVLKETLKLHQNVDPTAENFVSMRVTWGFRLSADY